MAHQKSMTNNIIIRETFSVCACDNIHYMYLTFIIVKEK